MKTIRNFLTFSKCVSLISSILITGGVVSSPYAQADGGVTGNPANNVVGYEGKKRNQLEKAQIIPQVDLNYNKYSSKARVRLAQSLEEIAYKVTRPSEILKLYKFPGDKAALEELYNKAKNIEGDYSEFLSANNPMSQYLNFSDYDDISAFLLETLSPTKEGYFYKTKVFPIAQETFPALADGLTMDAKVQINPEIKGACNGACSIDDYKKIPEGGIDLEVVCHAGPGHFISWNDKDNIEYSTGISAHLTTSEDVISISTPILTREASNALRIKYCNKPNERDFKISIECKLVPKNEKEKQKLVASFKEYSLSLGEYQVNLSNLKVESRKEFMAHSFAETSALGVDKSEMVGRLGGYTMVGYIGFRGVENVLSYKFDSDYSNLVLFKTETELVDMVRRSFVNSYEALNKKMNRDNY